MCEPSLNAMSRQKPTLLKSDFVWAHHVEWFPLSSLFYLTGKDNKLTSIAAMQTRTHQLYSPPVISSGWWAIKQREEPPLGAEFLSQRRVKVCAKEIKIETSWRDSTRTGGFDKFTYTFFTDSMAPLLKCSFFILLPFLLTVRKTILHIVRCPLRSVE